MTRRDRSAPGCLSCLERAVIWSCRIVRSEHEGSVKCNVGVSSSRDLNKIDSGRSALLAWPAVGVGQVIKCLAIGVW